MALSMSERGKLGAKKTNAMGGHKAEALRRKLSSEEHRMRINSGRIIAQLQKAADGKIDLTPTQITAGKILLDKSLATLTAVESTTIDPAATRSEAELYADLKALIAAHPDLIQSALAEHAREQGKKPSDAPQQTPIIGAVG